MLTSAIDKYVFVIIKKRFDDKIYINYSKKETVDHVDEIQHELVREAMRVTGVTEGVEITTLADIPSEGLGLGSSSSITVGLLQVLYAYQGTIVTADDLAKEACQIEIGTLGKPIGKQDQYIAAFGNMRFISFNPDDTVQVESVPLSEETKRRFSQSLMLFYTNITRQASSVLEEQKENIPGNKELLQKLKSLALEARSCVQEGSFDSIGELMHSGWELKKQLASGITNGEIDTMYHNARKVGAIGGKIIGAGGGGFLLLYCPSDKQDNVRSALRHLRELPLDLERDGTKVIFNIRR